MNSINVIGRITRDLELRQTGSGVPYVRFDVAVRRKFAKEGQRNADFLPCIAWRNTAEFIAKYCSKGSMIGVHGAMQSNVYEKDGKNHYTYAINVEDVTFAGSKNNNNGNAPAVAKTEMSGMADFSQLANEGYDMDDFAFIEDGTADDLPF